jgi:chromosome segregation protein
LYLKRLEMLGFKSFALRTILEFSPGITAVVGPNGAGKSNVADSMRWVLGEQSMRQLRGKKSDDVIFVGGQGKAPLGMAEVSLTLDNSTGWVPSEYSEITVTRRSYRSGENEYLINKQKVRLRDVLLLLAQARIGHDSYTVIGQGMIDATLSLRAEERRTLFEDAAGIRPFQVQRLDAENRLKQTEQNLERLRDIVLEIEPRLAPLAEQARRATEFNQLNRELNEVLLSWYSLQWRRLRTVSERAEQVEHEQSQQLQQLEQALNKIDEQTNTLRTARQQIQIRLAEARQNSAEANDFVQKLERDLAVNEERIGGLERQHLDVQQEERRLRERLIALQKRSIDLEEQCDLADESLDESSALLATLESQVAKAQKEYEHDERRLRNAQSDLIQVQARLGSSQTELGRVQKQLGERNRTLANRREAISHSQQNQRTLETRHVEERNRLNEVRAEEQQVTQRKQAVARTIADAQMEMDRLKSTLAEAERQRRSTQDRLTMLKNWRQSLSGYSDGVRALLRAQSGRIPNLLGPVPQLGLVPAGLETAMEAAFGPYMQAVVVRSLADAQVCLRYLHEQNAGKAMVVWTEREGEDDESHQVNRIQAEVEEQVLQRFLGEFPALKESIAGFAWKYIQCEPRYQAFFRRILHGIVLARDLPAACALFDWALPLSLSSNSDLPFESVATVKGEVLHINGWLTGGNGKDGTQGLLAHERELRELPQQLENQKNLLEQLNTMISDIQRAQEGRRAEQQMVDRELQKVTTRLNELNKQVNTTQREQERLQTEIQLAASVEQQLASEVAGLEQEVLAAQERVHAHEKSQHEMAGLLEELQIEMEDRALTFRRQQDELGKNRTSLAVKRQEAKAMRQQLTTQQQQTQELKSQLEQQVARLKEQEQRKVTLQQAILQQQVELEQAHSRSQILASELKKIEEQLTWVDQQIHAIEKQRMQQQQLLTQQEGLYRRSLLDSQRAHDALDALLGQLHDELGIEDPKELANPTPIIPDTSVNTESTTELEHLSEEEESQLRKLRRRIETLRARLKAMGGCDINAPELYEETRTRYEFLTTQIADMEQAALQLRTIIGQLDANMARQFEATFQAVNTRFREHFTTLFNGGSARLELIASKMEEGEVAPSSMPAGIDVIVQPPGKKVQDLALLSGGERALVAAALLFSLLEINPPPFCLLDEVDAALDESNVTRFCDILKRLAQRTQFIVITHNRVTMTAAQVIYGVSMRDSVSRLLSLRLEEVAVAGDR